MNSRKKNNDNDGGNPCFKFALRKHPAVLKSYYDEMRRSQAVTIYKDEPRPQAPVASPEPAPAPAPAQSVAPQRQPTASEEYEEFLMWKKAKKTGERIDNTNFSTMLYMGK